MSDNNEVDASPISVQATETKDNNTSLSVKARNYTLVILTIVYAFNFIDRQLLAILQESIKTDLGLSDSQLGLLTGFAFAVFYVTAGISIARWADQSNRRNIISLAVFVWSFMTAISGLAQNYLQLLLARIGVGVGEAGGSPASHSIISDIFPAHQRASAIGFYSTGVGIGILFGFLFGGWLNEFFGWRVAFMVVGVPGIVLALLVRMTLKEPVRGHSENRQATSTAVPFRTTMALLWSRRSFRHMAFGAGLSAFAGYSMSSWTASFIIRSHDMATGELGTWLALSFGVGGMIGVFSGGLLGDKLAPKDKRWYVWLPALVGFISVPFNVAIFLVDNVYVALSILIIPGVLSLVYLGNVIATTHGLVGLRMRAMSSAILFFILNIIGLGAGPYAVGFLSDYLEPSLGTESLRHAMLYLLPAVGFWSACHLYMAGKTLREDLQAAPD
jgi:predicted MFS family arabinose efflux permease